MRIWIGAIYISLLSHIGCLIRLLIYQIPYIQDVTMPISGVLFANALACLITGITMRISNSLERSDYNDTIVLAIKTGLCGSISSFSSVIINEGGVFDSDTTHIVTSITDVFIHIVLTYSTALSFLKIAAPAKKSIALSVSDHSSTHHDSYTSKIESYDKVNQIKDIINNEKKINRSEGYLLFTGVVLWLIVLSTCIGIAFKCEDRSCTEYNVTLAVLFAPVGAIIRWQLGRLNSVGSWPYGTAAANIIATTIGTGMAYGSQADRGNNYLVAQYAITQGVCGCLSTMSTLVTELAGMAKLRSWIYGCLGHTVSLSIGLLMRISLGLSDDWK